MNFHVTLILKWPPHEAKHLLFATKSLYTRGTDGPDDEAQKKLQDHAVNLRRLKSGRSCCNLGTTRLPSLHSGCHDEQVPLYWFQKMTHFDGTSPNT
ncbi:hypothetical protein VNO78_21954 [Psophocarpus tetragonolobus]|uniref:Uncharacterized protein n=1 Tax=Psophocarpus tetragonolobus TaxID=3891 RepID=A0AAN9XIG9_PSOTE